MNNTSHRIAVSKILLHNLARVWIIDPGNETKKLGGICPCKFTATFATNSHGLFAWYSFDTTKRHLMCFSHVSITCLRDNELPLKQDIFVTHVTKSLPDDFLDSSHNTAVHLINTQSWNSSLSSQHHIAPHSISSLRSATTSKVQINQSGFRWTMIISQPE